MNPQEYYESIQEPVRKRHMFKKDFMGKEVLAVTPGLDCTVPENEVPVLYDPNNPRFAYEKEQADNEGRTLSQIDIQRLLEKKNDLVTKIRNSKGALEMSIVLPITDENGNVANLIVEGNSTEATNRKLSNVPGSGFDTRLLFVIDPSTFEMDDVVRYQLLIHAGGKTPHTKYAQASLVLRAASLPEFSDKKELAVIIDKSEAETADWLAAHELHKKHEAANSSTKKGNSEKNFTLWQRFHEGVYKDEPEASVKQEAFEWWSKAMTMGHLAHTAIVQPKLVKDIWMNTTLRKRLLTDTGGIKSVAESVEMIEPSGIPKSLVSAARKFEKLVPKLTESSLRKIKDNKTSMAAIVSGYAAYEHLYKMVMGEAEVKPAKRGRPGKVATAGETVN